MALKNSKEVRGWSQNQTVYQREVLYQEIWSCPMVEVAKKYGISDAAIRKACKTMNIPTPPVGYWAKKKAGKEEPIPPLPPSTGPSIKYGHWKQVQQPTLPVNSMMPLGTIPFDTWKMSPEEREREARKREEENRQQEERKRKYNAEVLKTRALLNQAEDYETACKIRALVAAAEQNGHATPEWIAWAKAKADWYDPTLAARDACFGVRNHRDSAERKELKEIGTVQK